LAIVRDFIKLIFLDQVSSKLRSLFSPNMPISLRCFAILNGDAVGRILVDDPMEPEHAIVQEMGDGAIYMGGLLTAPILSEAINLLRKDKDVIIGVWHDDPRLAWLLSLSPDYDGAAIDFTNRPVGEGLRQFLPVPEGCRLQAIDADLFQRLAHPTRYVSVFGSVEKALEKGLGYCLMRDDTILCEAFAGPSAYGVIEIGVGTPESYRRRGYATVTCAHLIRTCEERGTRTFWNTAKQNTASKALARKLGYRTEQEFRVLAWLKRGQ
jgi:RimJ/RimL family protein N-acetyltransferase